jgi:hypothetical protein
MFCPECGEEYRPGFDLCADRDVPLVDELPEPREEAHDVELVTVLATSDAALIAVAKSLLDAAEIPFAVRGEGVQDLFGAGRFPGNINVPVGPVEFQVGAQDKEDALVILENLADDVSAGIEPESGQDV